MQFQHNHISIPFLIIKYHRLHYQSFLRSLKLYDLLMFLHFQLYLMLIHPLIKRTDVIELES